MRDRILSIAIERDTDIILARQRTRQIAQALGFDSQDSTRITTAVSEIVRNAMEYGNGGKIEYNLRQTEPQSLDITVIDNGPGIKDVEAVLDGRHESATGMGIGITGARRLMDDFVVETSSAGTKICLSKHLPKRAPAVNTHTLRGLAETLAIEARLDPIAEVRRQNQETLLQYQELRSRQEELTAVNQELQDTNRGVVALYAELEERADHLRRADQLKSRFLSNMSHEFRTPLNSILSLSRMLLAQTDGKLTAEQEKQVHFVRRAAENLTELVNDLLDLARIEAGKTVVVVTDFSVSDLFGALRGMLRPLLVGDAVALTFDEPQDLPLLQTDEAKVSQVLRNFISNAIKFTEHGEIRISVSRDESNDQIIFSVADTGIGIRPEHQGTIWEEFAQVPNRLQGKVKGTGLGLPLAKRFAVLLGGHVEVESKVGQGSTFRLVVPRRYKPAEAQSIPPEWVVEDGRTPILVLEDNPADAFNIERAFTKSRYQAITAQSTSDARRALEEFRPAAVVMDILLQGEESWRFLIEMKQSESYRDIPIIVVSTVNEERKAVSFGADAYIDKPADPAHLVSVVDKLTGGSSVTRVLLVDDEEVSRYLIRQLLPRGAYHLQETATGREGLEVVTNDPPDVVLFDINMPEMNGYEFLERLYTIPGKTPPPAIAITAMMLDEAHRARLKNATKIVSKFDLTTDVLVEAIRDVMDKRESQAA